MSKQSSNTEIICPCCRATLLVDPKTGLVLRVKEKKPDYSFEEAMTQIKSRKDQSDQLFQKALQDEEKRQQSLEEKFRKAVESEEELEDPLRPWELD